jgi:hypothetical protein
MNIPLLGIAGLAFVALAWGTLRRPMLGLGLLLALLPLLSFARRFLGDSPLFPSLETLAVLMVWCCVQVGKVVRHDRWVATAGVKRSGGAAATRLMALLFLAAGLLSSLLSRNPELSLRILLTGGLVPLLAYSIASETKPDWESLKPVVWGMVVLSLQVGIYTVLTFRQRQGMAGGEAYFYSWMYNQANSVNIFVVPSVAVSMVIPAIPLAAWYTCFGRSSRRGLVPAAVAAAVLVVVVLSMSRGSWVAAAVALVGSLPIFLRRVRVGPVLLALGVIALLYSLGLLDVAREVVANRLGSSRAMHNVDVRQANFLLALQSAPGHLFAGVGLGQYAELYRAFPAATASLLPPLWFAHSLLLTLIPEIGLVGALAFAGLLTSGLLRGLRLAVPAVETGDKDGREPVRLLGYALVVGVMSFVVIASTAGAHLVSYLENTDVSRTHFMSSALLVVFILLGAANAISNQCGLRNADFGIPHSSFRIPNCP